MAVTYRVLKTIFQVRRGQSEAWARVNPVLRPGEPGFELDTYLLKIGDGETPYNELPYINKNSYTFSPDNKSLILNSNNEIMLYGYNDAESGQIPIKGENGKIEWIDIPEEAESISESRLLEILV